MLRPLRACRRGAGAPPPPPVTVRLDPERYERLKIHGAKTRRTNQDILVEALDAYFAAKA
jgi:predicted transcriptional regulator